MTQIFKSVVSISISGAVLALFLLGLRYLLLGKIRPYAYIVLWGILALRLLLPFNFESRLSMYNYAPDQLQEMVATAPFAASPQTPPVAPRTTFPP